MAVLDFQFKAKQRAILWDLSAGFKGNLPIFFLSVYLFLLWPDILIENVFWDCSLCLSSSLQRPSQNYYDACKPLPSLRTKNLVWRKKNRSVFVYVAKYSIFSDLSPYWATYTVIYLQKFVKFKSSEVRLPVFNPRLTLLYGWLWTNHLTSWFSDLQNWHDNNILWKLNDITYREYFTQCHAHIKYSITVSNY